MSPADRVFYKWGSGVGADLPRIDSAHDEFLVTDKGEEIIDAAAGAAVVNLGHSLDGVRAVAERQIGSVSYVSLSKFTHRAPERLADQLVAIAPGDLSTVFYTNSGSEANETAFKLATQYHRDRGDPGKSKIIGRWQSYHGATIGALSASGNTSRRVPYDSLLASWPHIPPAYPYRWPYDGTEEDQAIAAARELERTIEQEGAETVAAFIAEPVSGASIPAAHPHPAYFEEIRRICDRYDVLFIADEVMTGFGRTGPMVAMDHFDVVPDILVLGKGITSGYAPLSAIVTREPIAEVFRAGEGPSFDHGHTFGGNPLSTAIAEHVVGAYTDDILDTGRERGQRLAEQLETLVDHPMVGEIRSIGPMIGIEFVRDPETKEPFEPDEHVRHRLYAAALDEGVYTYPGGGSVDGTRGDHLMLAPPLTTSVESIDRIARGVIAAVDQVYADR